MKILVIRGKNLASLESEFEIDFTKEPLKSAGIFAITGQTGAGKSTILDALCLALFDDMPRLNKAEASINISDVEDKTITQKDSRNILRRGASEGFAEVEFVALNGDIYRSRWMVHRARGKAEGALQPTIIKLENLSTGSEEQGTKSVFINRISELIGLTFDQFTRAVLLAQGDFANFLKAKSNEKAEILEKLTGTEIYSKISTVIYQKTSEAKNALELLQQRIKDIKLLSNEELEALEIEKTNFDRELTPLKQQTLSVEKRLAWIKQKEQIESEILQAQETLDTIQLKIQEASNRYNYMSMIEASQEIRDSYIDLANKKTHQEKLHADIELKENELKLISDQLESINTNLLSSKSSLEQLEQRYNSIKPDLNRAKELDIEIRTVEEKINDIDKELTDLKGKESSSRKTVENLEKQQQESESQKNVLAKWFADNEIYAAIIPHIDLINTLINTAVNAKAQNISVSESLKTSKSLLITYQEQLLHLEEEAQRLNSLLPTEIINLRKRLEEGQPCPVCGSLHHPSQIDINQDDKVNEKELEDAKTNVNESINKTKESIDKTRETISKFEIHISGFNEQYEKAYNSLKEMLQALPHWDQKLTEGLLQSELTKAVSKWNVNKDEIDKCTVQIANNVIKIESENKILSSLSESIQTKGELFKTQALLFKEKSELRKKLLNGKSVNEVENAYTTKKEQLTKQYEDLRTQKDKIESQKSSITGVLSQLKNDTELNKQKIVELASVVKNWLSSNKHEITEDILKDLMSKSREWIESEKKYLSEIKDKELIAKTTVEERKFRLNNHSESTDKPDDDQTKDILSEELKTVKEKENALTKRLAEIEVSLLSHQKNKEQIKAFENELNDKTETFNNWAKLNDLLGSSSGDRFKRIAQGYTLDVLLEYANKHLEELTRRYRLEKISDTLALQIIDNDMFGDVRTVHSLSGGESFLISLALALGLSSLSSNRMKIESLFIDEGFGSLDVDTLNVAMDALESLQTQGRKIGVISHVEEMKERIAAQIQVVKLTNGRSNIKITNHANQYLKD